MKNNVQMLEKELHGAFHVFAAECVSSPLLLQGSKQQSVLHTWQLTLLIWVQMDYVFTLKECFLQ